MLSGIALLSLFATSSCADEPENEETKGLDNLKTEIKSDGTTTSGAIFSDIDGTTFWLDYVKYKIVDSHLEIIGYDEIELPKEPKLYAEVKLNGVTLKTRILDSDAFREAKLKKLIIPNTVTLIKDRCFYKCSSLLSIVLSEKTTYLGVGCFAYCTSLTSIDLPIGITSIGEACFYYCSSLSSIIFPETVTEIGLHAYSECKSLRFIVFMPNTPPNLSYSYFDDPYNPVIVYIPQESLDKYKNDINFEYNDYKYLDILPIE